MSKRAFFLVTAVLSCALLLPGGEPADYWPQWRGAHQNGSSTTAKNLPVSWSETENVQVACSASQLERGDADHLGRRCSCDLGRRGLRQP